MSSPYPAPGESELPAPDRQPVIDKLIEQFPPVDEAELGARFVSNPILSAVLRLSGLPIEQCADRLLDYYTGQVQRRVNQLRETDHPWNPGHWNVVAPPYLFAGLDELFGLTLIHNRICPEWQVFIVRSPEWWSAQLQDGPATTWFTFERPDPHLADLYGHIIRRNHPFGGPPDEDPRSFVKITGV